jgi:hypothetical protein
VSESERRVKRRMRVRIRAERQMVPSEECVERWREAWRRRGGDLAECVCVDLL